MVIQSCHKKLLANIFGTFDKDHPVYGSTMCNHLPKPSNQFDKTHQQKLQDREKVR